jgi:YegS/Rv2252/BmrU family lipid kinase
VSNKRTLPKKAILIVNTMSRVGAEGFGQAVELLKAAGIELIEARSIDHPARIKAEVRQAVDEAPMVIIGGGDGTLSSTIDYFKDHDTVFALLPLGTANSFARSLGIPLDLPGAVDVIAKGAPRTIDLGCIDGDYFGNSAAIGLSPRIAKTVPHKLKRYLGRAGYALWAGYISFKFRPFRLQVDDGLTRTTVWTSEVRIANGGFFGGVELVDSAQLDSGEIIVQAVTGRAKKNLFWSWFLGVLRHRSRNDYNAEFHGTKLRIDTDPTMDVSIDGELAARTPITVSVAPDAVTIAAPREEREKPAGA